MSQHCAYYQSVSLRIVNLICIHLTREHMNGNWESNCWFMGSSWFVTVSASLHRLLPVWDSLRQFVTAGASQTACDCHIANPVFWNRVLCSIALYANPRWVGYVFNHLRCARFLSLTIKTIAKMGQKPQHVGNISSDIPYVLTLLCHIGHSLHMKKMARRKWGGDTSSSVWICI